MRWTIPEGEWPAQERESASDCRRSSLRRALKRLELPKCFESPQVTIERHRMFGTEGTIDAAYERVAEVAFVERKSPSA